jgi:hypothetical protein
MAEETPWEVLVRLEASLDNEGITDKTWSLIDKLKELITKAKSDTL